MIEADFTPLNRGFNEINSQAVQFQETLFLVLLSIAAAMKIAAGKKVSAPLNPRLMEESKQGSGAPEDRRKFQAAQVP